MKWENDVASSGPSAGGILGDRARQRPSRRRLYFVPFYFRHAALIHSLSCPLFLTCGNASKLMRRTRIKLLLEWSKY